MEGKEGNVASAELGRCMWMEVKDSFSTNNNFFIKKKTESEKTMYSIQLDLLSLTR